jgi:uncharacterized repeat protein (TIGR03837 family)
LVHFGAVRGLILMKARWDIFCNVVDNYGDIGVTWRLARQLAAEHGFSVRLWVDEPAAFLALCPEADPQLTHQVINEVEVCHWGSDWRRHDLPQVMVEAFGCNLPEHLRRQMAQATQQPLWLNLEYLSAEEWVGGCHGLSSPQGDGLKKFFFFPGFTPDTGGLVREQDLLQRRDAVQKDPQAREAFLKRLGVVLLKEARLISLFAYENPGLGEWLDALAEDCQVTQLLVPKGRILGDLQQWLGQGELSVGDTRRRGSLQVQILPFVSQDDFDRLLWSCDFNAVRGEDSFVRAQWAARPMLWHIYKQEEQAHLEKLQAFLELYKEGLSPAASSALSNLWGAWNVGVGMGQSWRAVLDHWPELDAHAEQWCLQQGSQRDLATALAQFYRNWLSCAA